MRGHVVNPVSSASFSRKIVHQPIRGGWGCQGLPVTDDLTMGAARNRGLRNATVRALCAGVDLLLIACDHDKYFDAMHCTRQAARRGALDLPMLERSSARRLQPFR